MPYKKKATPGTVQLKRIIAELPEKQEKVKAQVNFRHDLLEPLKRINYKNEFDRLQGAKRLPGLECQYKNNKNERTTEESDTITERRTISSYLFYQVSIKKYYNI